MASTKPWKVNGVCPWTFGSDVLVQAISLFNKQKHTHLSITLHLARLLFLPDLSVVEQKSEGSEFD